MMRYRGEITTKTKKNQSSLRRRPFYRVCLLFGTIFLLVVSFFFDHLEVLVAGRCRLFRFIICRTEAVGRRPRPRPLIGLYLRMAR